MARPASVLLGLLLAAGLVACGGATKRKPLPEKVVGTTPTTSTTPSAGKGDAAAGKKLFTSLPCAGCHTLADAGAKGTVGPNLDDAKPSFALVVDRVTNGAGVMPSFKSQLSAKQIQDLAAYVSSVAGK